MSHRRSQILPLLKGLVDAPIGTLREMLFRASVMALACTVWLTRTWPGAIFGTVILVGVLWGGLHSQRRAEQDGRVEEERQRQERFRSKVHRWPWWGRIVFFLVALAVLASSVFDQFSS